VPDRLPQKLARVVDLSAASRQMAAARIRREHPGADETEIKMRLAELVLGRETMRRVFDWDPDRR
jgi:Rv0078B-related antitoxin